MSGLPSREIVVSIGAVAALRLASYCVYRRWTSGHEPGHASTVEDSLNQIRNDANSENLSSQETETQDVVNNCSNLSTSGRFHGETGDFNSSSTNIERDNQTVFNEGIDLLPPSGLTPRGHNNDASSIDGQATDIVIDSSQSMHDKQTGIGIDSTQSTGDNDEDDIVVDSSQPSGYTIIDTSQSTGDHYTDIVVDSFPETHDSHTCSYSGNEVINQTESNPNKTKLKTTGAVGPKGDNNQICVGLKLSPSFTIEEGQKGVIAVDHISSCTGITWFFGGGGIAAPQEIKTSEEGKYSGGSMAYPSLIIQDTTKQDSGYYFCVVKYEDREEESNRTYLVVNSKSKGSEEKIVNYTMIKEVTNFHSGKSDEIVIQHESSDSDDSQNTDSSDEGSEQDTSHLENARQRDVEIEAKVDEETLQSSKDVLEKMIKLAQKFNFSVTDVFKDGNCLFHAASQQMESSINSESHFAENARVLRRAVVDFLRNNSETPEGEPYNKWLRDESWESFLDRMSRDGEYGNEIILRAICHRYNINVHVLSTLNEEAFTSYRAASDDSYTIFLGHDHNSQHYVILKPIDDRKEADSDLIDRANSYQSQQSLEVDTAPLPPRRPSHDVPSGLLGSFTEHFDETFHDQTFDSTANIPSSYPSIISRREEEEEEEIAEEEEESISDTLPDTDTLVLEEARNDDVQLLESQSFQNVHPQLIQVPMHIQTSDLMEHSLSKNEPIHAQEILNISNGNDPQPRSTDFQHPSRQGQGQTVTMGAEGGHCVSSGYGSSMSLSSNQLTPESENENQMRSVPLPDAEPYATSTEQNNSSQEEEVPVEVFDAVILHANADNEEVHDFIDNMNEEFPDLNVNLTTYEEFNLGKSLLSSAPLLFNKSRFVFVFKTQNFITEEIVKFLNEILLLSVITEEEKFHRLIPIDKDDVHVPELGPIIPLKYNRYLRAKGSGRTDQSYVRAFPRLIREGRNKYLNMN